MRVRVTATNAGVPVNGLTDDPEITIRRLDTGAAVVTAAAMNDVGSDGLYEYEFQPTGGLVYSFLIDADPQVTSQVSSGERYFDGAINSDQAMNYEGRVWYDASGGEAGTDWPVGTRARPSNDEASVRTIADREGTKHIMLDGLFSADQSYIGFTFEAIAGGGSVNANSQDMGGCIFNAVGITGTFASTSDMFGTAMSFVGTTSNWRGVAVRPALSGTITVAAGQIGTFAQGASIVAGVSTPSIGVSGVGTQLNLRAYSGGMFITDMDDATSNASLEFTAGQCIIENTNTAGTIVVRGVVDPITDNSAGATVIKTAALQPSDVRKSRKILDNRQVLNSITQQLELYEDDDSGIEFTADAFLDEAGAQPYDGSGGVVRRDRFT